MTKPFFKNLIFNTFLLSLSLSAFGQNEELSTEELMAVFNMRFDIARPDTSFIETEQGWAEEATQSQIACTALPASFERVMEDFKDFINAAYPKSQRERLYQKMLATFATVKKKGD
jgi:hypothetical protein